MSSLSEISIAILLAALSSTTRPAGRELMDRPLAETKANTYRLAIMQAQKPQDLEALRKIEAEINKTEAEWKKHQAASKAKRQEINRQNVKAASKTKQHEDRLEAKDAARDRHQEALKVCGAARKAIASLRRGISLADQAAIHFKYGQEKKAINASNSAAAALVAARKEWPALTIGETSAWAAIWNSQNSVGGEIANALGLHLVTVCDLAEKDPWLAAHAWSGVDRHYQEYMRLRTPEPHTQSRKMLDLILRTLPKLDGQGVDIPEKSIRYWAELAAPPKQEPPKRRF